MSTTVVAAIAPCGEFHSRWKSASTSSRAKHCLLVGLLAALGVLGKPAFLSAAPMEAYQAQVQAPAGEEAYIRSGPGKKYYPTLKLPNGTKVIVRRHDAGGWYKIDPPPGSFSWIPGKYVQTNGGPQGVVTENYVVVRVGSFESDVRDVEQRRLNRGDTVEILGEKTFKSEKGNELWYKITSPPGEQRWIQGQYLIALNADGTPKSGVKAPLPTTSEPQPIAPPTSPSGTQPRSRQPAIARTAPRSMGPLPGDGGDAPLYGHKPSATAPALDEEDPFTDSPDGGAVAAGSSATEPRTAASAGDLATMALSDLNMLDTEFKNMLQLPAAEWDIASYRQEYETLLEAVGNDVPVVAGQVRNRLSTLNHYETIHQNAADVARITRETSERDQQLQGFRPANPAERAGGASQVTQTETSPRPAPTGSASAPRSSRFDGAGIVRRLPKPAPGEPRHVLTAPNGRFLAYLVAEGNVNLDQYVGQPSGLIGPRGFVPQLKGDLIRVRQVAPVQLAP